MKNNSYKEFSQIYDVLMNDIDYEKWTSFIVKRTDVNNKILEAACGTGSITSILAEKNLNVTAFDLSEDMLMKAYEKLGRNRNVKLLNQDMKSFKISDKFGMAICCCDGVNYLDNEDALSFFESVYNHLDEHGRFIFDISTPHKYETMFNDTYVYDDGDIFYVWENELDEENKLVNVEINFFVSCDDGRYDRITEQQTQYVHDVKEVILMLKNAGFKDIEVFDDYNDSLYNENSLRAVFCAAKS